MKMNGLDIQVFKNKKIFLYGPRFYGYCEIIKENLENMGATVKYCESYIFLEEWKNNRKIIDWLFRRIRNPFFKSNHTNQIIKEIGNEKFDIFLTISVYSANENLIKHLKKINPDIKSIIYFWDAFSTWDFSNQIKYFDKSFTFDLEDSIRYKELGLKHMPLFWNDIPIITQNKSHSKKYDLVHIGTLHPKYNDRAELCSEIANICKHYNRKYFIYLLTDIPKGTFKNLNIKQKFKYIFNIEYREYVKRIQSNPNYDELIHTKPLSQELVAKIENSTNCILDISLGRAGVAMRTIGALARNTKVITTNKFITKEQFYSKEKIYLINRNNPIIDFKWLDNVSSTSIDIQYLYIKNWLKILIGV